MRKPGKGRCESAGERQCESAGERQCESAGVRKCESGGKRQCESRGVAGGGDEDCGMVGRSRLLAVPEPCGPAWHSPTTDSPRRRTSCPRCGEFIRLGRFRTQARTRTRLGPGLDSSSDSDAGLARNEARARRRAGPSSSSVQHPPADQGARCRSSLVMARPSTPVVVRPYRRRFTFAASPGARGATTSAPTMGSRMKMRRTGVK